MNACLLILSSLLMAAPSEDAKVLFEDRFEEKLRPGWEWVREDKSEWRIVEGTLEVRSQFGRIWGGNDAKNLLLAPLLKSPAMAVRVSVAHQPKELWEQAGPVWYLDDDNFVKLISEQIRGEMYVVVAREIEGRGKVVGKIEVAKANFDLRLVVRGDQVTGQWRMKKTDKWSDAGTCEFDVKGKPRFALFTQNGSKETVRWVRFDNFAIEKLPKK